MSRIELASLPSQDHFLAKNFSETLPNSLLKLPSPTRPWPPSIHQSTKLLGAKSRTLHHHSRDEFIILLLSRWGKLQSVTMTLFTIFFSVLCVCICELCNWRHQIFRIFLLIFLRFSVYYWVNFENSFMMHVTILCPFMCFGNFQS